MLIAPLCTILTRELGRKVVMSGGVVSSFGTEAHMNTPEQRLICVLQSVGHVRRRFHRRQLREQDMASLPHSRLVSFSRVDDLLSKLTQHLQASS